MAAAIHDGRFEAVKREHTPLVPIWENGHKLPGQSNEWHKQIYNVNSITDYTVAKLKKAAELRAADPLKATLEEVSAEEWELQNDPALKIEANLELIEQHVDRRLQLFFMQLICCYRTPYHFEWIEANDEYGKGGSVTMKNPNGNRDTVLMHTQAAHSGTFPCLVAYPRDRWERGERTGGFVYLKYGRSYLDNNATVEFDRYMNQSDTAIDGTHKNSQLREAAIKIVNSVAEGRCNVERGMRKFAKLLEEYCIKYRDKPRQSVSRRLVLEQYVERVQYIRAAMDHDPKYFDQLLGVKIDDHPREAILRDVVYRKRFKLIQECEAIESRVARAILDSQNAMLHKNNNRINSVDARLRYILLEENDPLFKRPLEKLFCTSLDQLQADIEKNEARLRAFERTNQIESFRVTHRVAIETLKRDLRLLFRSLDNAELNFRAELFKGLRTDLNEWYQKDFVASYKGKYPTDAMSISMVSRLEQRTRHIAPTKAYITPLSQRRKDMDEIFALKIADTFGVDAGLFLPALVSSVY